MFYYRTVFICIVLLTQTGFGQFNDEIDSSKNNFSLFNNSNDVNYPNRLDSIQPFIFYNYNSKIFTIYKPDYNLIRDKLTYSILIQRSLFPPPIKLSDTIDGFSLFKESLHHSLALEYKKRLKYDLGEFGRYLGLSKQIFAIILGIISLL